MYAKVICLVLALAYAAPLEDLVTEFPGIPGGPPDFAWYSGFLNIPHTGKYYHYVFVESQNDPATDPLVVWLTGGPGCSSMLGFLYEHGPYVYATEAIDLHENPYSWNKNASMIYLESPAGVGFSYYTEPEEADTNDYITAHDNVNAMLAWFQKFPEFAFHDFYISGESYGGIYVPTMAYNILLHNEHTTSNRINLKGISVGNGCTDWTVDTTQALLQLAWTHSLYGYDLYNNMTEYSCIENVRAWETPANCTATMDTFNNEIMPDINIYDIYKPCYSAGEEGYARFLKGTSGDLMSGVVPPCTDARGIDMYLRNQTVLDAYHIPPEAFEWVMCADPPQLNYTSDYVHGSLYTYPYLINSGLKILIYSGDVDGAVPTIGTRQWIKKLNLPILEDYASWTITEGQVSGYKLIYDGLTFVTVKGTGHMVPQWKRPEALHLINAFWHDLPIQPKNFQKCQFE